MHLTEPSFAPAFVVRSLQTMARALAIVGTFSLVACSSDDAEEGGQCRQASGPTSIAPECNADASSAERTRSAETFRTHVADASSAAGIARSQMDAATGWFVTCLGDAIAQTIAATIIGAPPGELNCGEWDAASSYAFASGDYRFDLRQSVSYRGTPLLDRENSATLRFVFTKPLAGHAEGEVVPFNLGRADTFLEGLRLVDDGGRTALAFDRPGPLVELLGLGPTPPSPIVLTEANARKAQETMRSSLAVEGSTRASLGDCGYESAIELAFDCTALNADVHPRLVSAITTAKGSTEPRVVAKTWDVTYPASTPGVPTGSVEAHIPTDTLASKVTVRFTGSDPADAQLELACTPR